MKKSEALKLLGGSATSAAQAIGVTPAAISLWPDDLPPRISDRVIAAMVRTRRAIPSEYKSKPHPGSPASAQPMPGLSKRAQKLLTRPNSSKFAVALEPAGSALVRLAKTRRAI